MGEWASGRNGDGASGRVGVSARWSGPRSRTACRAVGFAEAGGRFSEALVGFAEEDAAGAGGAGEDAFTGRFVHEIGVGRDAADSDL
jgi:hypothetical protein